MIRLTDFPYTENYEDGTYTFRVRSSCCGKDTSLRVQGADLFRYNQGARIQEAFPEMPPAERELLISGTCGECWAEMFKDMSDTNDYEWR